MHSARDTDYNHGIESRHRMQGGQHDGATQAGRGDRHRIDGHGLREAPARGAGFDVLGYDVDAGKLARLAALGGRAARSVAEIARACRRVVLAVFNTDQVEDVIEGPQGLLAGAAGGRAARHRDLRQHLRPRPHRRARRAPARRTACATSRRPSPAPASRPRAARRWA